MGSDFWLKASAITSFQYIPQKPGALYRWLDDSKTGSGGQRHSDEVRKVAGRHGVFSLPAYFRLEEARLNLIDAARHARRGQLVFPAATARPPPWHAVPQRAAKPVSLRGHQANHSNGPNPPAALAGQHQCVMLACGAFHHLPSQRLYSFSPDAQTFSHRDCMCPYPLPSQTMHLNFKKRHPGRIGS